MRNAVLTATIVLLLTLLSSCNPSAFLALLNCSFRVENTDEFAVCGILLDELDELTIPQMAQVVAYWADGECPVDFTLNIGIRNPNTGSGDTLETTATMVSFAWDLYLDTDSGKGFDTTWVCSGATEDHLTIPGTGETVLLPLGVQFDAFTILGGIMEVPALVELMLAIGGAGSDVRDEDHLGRLLLKADPSFETPFGDIAYPGGIWIGLDWVD